MKALSFQEDALSTSVDNLKDHYVLVVDLTSMQNGAEICHCRELVGEPARVELNFTCPVEYVTEPIVLGKRMSSAAFDKFGVVGKHD